MTMRTGIGIQRGWNRWMDGMSALFCRCVLHLYYESAAQHVYQALYMRAIYGVKWEVQRALRHSIHQASTRVPSMEWNGKYSVPCGTASIKRSTRVPSMEWNGKCNVPCGCVHYIRLPLSFSLNISKALQLSSANFLELSLHQFYTMRTLFEGLW